MKVNSFGKEQQSRVVLLQESLRGKVSAELNGRSASKDRVRVVEIVKHNCEKLWSSEERSPSSVGYLKVLGRTWTSDI